MFCVYDVGKGFVVECSVVNDGDIFCGCGYVCGVEVRVVGGVGGVGVEFFCEGVDFFGCFFVVVKLVCKGVCGVVVGCYE